jgi:hypothetical protein
MIARPWCVLSILALGCSSKAPDSRSTTPLESDSGPPTSIADAGADVAEASPGTSVEHGEMVDYETLSPVQGLTVTDNGLSTTTDANGQWSLTVPTGATLQPTVTSSTYSRLLFPDSIAVAADIDFSTVVIPDSNTYSLEESVLDMDTSKALVQLVVLTQSSCASAVGGTVSVTSPSGARLAYFDATSATPSTTLSSFQAVKPARPVAVIYDIDSSATLSLQVSHPTCKQVPFPVAYGGRQYEGTVRLSPAEPGGVNSAIVVVLE